MKRKSGRPTVFDVAELSGVSKSTVSNVVRNAPYLSAHTRERVLLAIAELGYRPNALARDLALRRTTTIGVVVGDLRNPFYSELTRQLEQHAARAGYAVIICDTSGEVEAERQKFELLIEHRVAGVLLLHLSGTAGIENLKDANIPVVGVSASERSIDYFVTDDAVGTRLAVEHLIELGHQNIAFVASPYPDASANAGRQRGWRTALRRAGMEARTVITWNEFSADQLHKQLLSPDAPTAFFAASDLTALDLIDGLESLGISVPGDVSVVGFDDIAVSSLNRLALTTVRQHARKLAAGGMECLLARINEGPHEGPENYVQRRLEPTLIVRATTARPRKRGTARNTEL